MPVFAIPGTADRNVPIDGGVGPAGVTNVSYRSLSESLAPFLSAASCADAPSSSRSGKYTQNRWQCSGTVEIMTMIVDGGAHEWPEGATNFLWDQLSRHAR
jgi:polyhydroxybutyrate depolymerase